MLKITPEGESGALIEPLTYATGRGTLGRVAMRLTRWLRAVNVEKYLEPATRHLDIGCGDGYFLRRSPCEERYGLDKLLGDEVTDRLDFPDAFFDVVTLLAVIEHLKDSRVLLKEIARVLKPGGQLILTTPKRSAEWLIDVYSKGVEDEHETYFDLKKIKEVSFGLFDVTGNHNFIFGLNQAFCLKNIYKG